MIMAASKKMDIMEIAENAVDESYAGSIIVILKDSSEVEAECPLETLKKLNGYSEINTYDQKPNSLPVQTTFHATEQESQPQELILVCDGQKKWHVKDIVK